MKKRPEFRVGEWVWLRGEDGKIHKKISYKLKVVRVGKVEASNNWIPGKYFYDVEDSSTRDRGRFPVSLLISEREMLALRLMEAKGTTDA